MRISLSHAENLEGALKADPKISDVCCFKSKMVPSRGTFAFVRPMLCTMVHKGDLCL